MTTIEQPTDVASAAASGASATERFHADKSPYAAVKDTPTERVDLLAREVLAAVHDTIRRHKRHLRRVQRAQGVADPRRARTASGRCSSTSGSSTSSRTSPPSTARATRAPSRARTTCPALPELGAKGTIPMRDGEHGTPLVWRGRSPPPTAHRCRARSSSGTPTTTASTRSSPRASPSGTCAAASPPAPTAPSRSPRFARAVPDPDRRLLRQADRRGRLARLASGPPAREGVGARATNCSPPSCTSPATSTTTTTSPAPSSPS